MCHFWVGSGEIYDTFSAILVHKIKLFQIWLQKVHDINFDILLLMIALSTSGLSLLLFCFFGKMATESYERMSISLFESDWKNLSIYLQKYVLLMIRNSQIPLCYHAFRVINLDLETFSKVIDSKIDSFAFILNDRHWATKCSCIFLWFQLLKTVFSYYMMFKTITAK